MSTILVSFSYFRESRCTAILPFDLQIPTSCGLLLDLPSIFANPELVSLVYGLVANDFLEQLMLVAFFINLRVQMLGMPHLLHLCLGIKQ